jgi:large subunit ribosomal protein L25
MEPTAVPEIRLSVAVRTEFGKGGARRTRRAGKIPAVIYGHGGETRHVALPAHDFANAIRKNGANALLTLDVEGAEQLAIAKAIQRHPIKPEIEHVDLLAVRRGEKVTVEVPLNVTGEIVAGGLLTQEFTTVGVEAEATAIPAEIEVSIEGKQIGDQITAGDLELPAGATLTGEADQVLLVISAAPTAEEIEAEVAEAADELGIVEDAPETEGDEAPAEGDAPADES